MSKFHESKLIEFVQVDGFVVLYFNSKALFKFNFDICQYCIELIDEHVLFIIFEILHFQLAILQDC